MESANESPSPLCLEDAESGFDIRQRKLAAFFDIRYASHDGTHESAFIFPGFESVYRLHDRYAPSPR